mgnify:CR=1 FL=1
MERPVVNELKAAAVACPWGSHRQVAVGYKEDTASYIVLRLGAKMRMRHARYL